ncbi:MAG: 4Fe-4S dicluster domain-containing protein [Thermoanaerobaculia bacterium]
MTNWYRSTDTETTAVDRNDDGRLDLDRRDFLKVAGFSAVGITATACTRPVPEKAIPFLVALEEIIPGKAYWMASTCHGCAARCGALVKCRDGRPIKLEGNPDHPLSRGGLCAVGQAGLLGLYDSQRLGAPLLHGMSSDWKSVDAFVGSSLANAKRVRLVSSTLASPTAKRVIAEFLARFPDAKHVVYDMPSASAIADAHDETHGVRAIPHYRFDRADVIVSFDADFLGTWISPVEFTKAWSSRRKAGASMSWHAQLEGRMSLTGSNADQRLRLRPSDLGPVLAYFAGRGPAPFQEAILGRIKQRLVAGRSLVVCGSSRLDDQLLTNEINLQLASYGNTIDLEAPSRQREGSDRDLAQLVADLTAGVDALFAIDCNPVYDLPNGDEVAKLLARVPLVVAVAPHVDETSRLAHALCPDHHFLESWSDSMPVDGVYTVTQPAIAPLRGTRSLLESLAAWSGKPAAAYDLVQATAMAHDWDKTLHDGFTSAVISPTATTSAEFRRAAAPAVRPPSAGVPKGSLELVLYAKLAMLDGRHAHNPWLHELPDPVTKVTWDNYAAISPGLSKELDVRDGDVVRVSADRESVDLPAFVQPGQHDQVVAIAYGYGRIGTDRFANLGPKWLQRRTHLSPGDTVGKRVVQLAKFDGVTIAKTGARHELASTQLHSVIDEGRPNPIRESHDEAHGAGANPHDLWPAKPKGPLQWAMAIDLSRCTGCSGCVIGCQAENNVPVVGKDEVLRQREMHWIRIDRYYAGEGDEVRAAYQPVMCIHCGNAPCETVCPVVATVHSSEGLNQQVYNRCVGTRYCANNCPIKTRRFNWFDYPHEDRFANLTLNPDVTVRSRGVMEKCSMCVQRIAEARIEARQLGLPIADGAIRTACEQSCPADAIVFGNAQDPKSRISQIRKDPRHYRLFDELNLEAAVGYLTLQRNA